MVNLSYVLLERLTIFPALKGSKSPIGLTSNQRGDAPTDYSFTLYFLYRFTFFLLYKANRTAPKIIAPAPIIRLSTPTTSLISSFPF